MFLRPFLISIFPPSIFVPFILILYFPLHPEFSPPFFISTIKQNFRPWNPSFFLVTIPLGTWITQSLKLCRQFALSRVTTVFNEIKLTTSTDGTQLHSRLRKALCNSIQLCRLTSYNRSQPNVITVAWCWRQKKKTKKQNPVLNIKFFQVILGSSVKMRATRVNQPHVDTEADVIGTKPITIANASPATLAITVNIVLTYAANRRVNMDFACGRVTPTHAFVNQV